jgi:peptidoglycan/LPS O-acetylase OafA/YrhL
MTPINNLSCSDNTMTTTKRIPELDSLRGIAALAVVLFHYFYNYNKHYGHNFYVSDLFDIGQTGVHLFFIISGFVIYWTLTKSENLSQFAWSRFSRLYPVYWAAVIVSFTFTSLVGPADRSVSFTDALINLTMFHEYVGIAHVDRVYWTLSIELAFYILVGSALFLGLTKHTTKICILWLTLALATRLLNINLGLLHKALILNWCHLFIAGIMFFQVWSGTLKIKFAAPIFLLSLATAYLANNGLNCIVVMAFYLIFPLAIFGKIKLLNQKILVWLGTISYSLYLVHQNIGYGIIQKCYSMNIPASVSITSSIIVSLAIAHLLTMYVEKPSMRKLRSLTKPQQQ